MPKEPSSIGMSDKVWNKVNSPKPEKIQLPLKKTIKKSEFKPLKDKDKNKVDLFIKFLLLLISSIFIKLKMNTLFSKSFYYNNLKISLYLLHDKFNKNLNFIKNKF